MKHIRCSAEKCPEVNYAMTKGDQEIFLESGWSVTTFMRSENAQADREFPKRYITGRTFLCADHTKAHTNPTDHKGDAARPVTRMLKSAAIMTVDEDGTLRG